MAEQLLVMTPIVARSGCPPAGQGLECAPCSLFSAVSVSHPCLTCGACCAFFRVSFHWSEADPALGGQVPFELTESLRTHERAMRGTSQANPRCVALDADIGRYSRCTIHDRRPSVCALVPASYEFGEASAQCDKARIAHGLAVLTAGDWAGVGEAEKNPLPEL